MVPTPARGRRPDRGDPAVVCPGVRALTLWPENPDSRYTLAGLRFAAGEHARAETLLVEQLRLRPGDAGSAELLERVRRDWQERRRQPATR